MIQHILSISCEENQQLLRAYLNPNRYHLISTQNTNEALVYLQTMQPFAIMVDYTVLDRSVDEFICHVKGQKQLAHIPIIKQISADTCEPIIQNNHGIFYYLIAPFRRSMLMATLENAATYSQAIAGEGQLENRCIFSFQNLQDIQQIAKMSAQFYPSPHEAIIGLKELMLNAVEHGNLGIGYEEKTNLKNIGLWEDEVNRRLNSPKHVAKFGTIALTQGDEKIEAVITDQGTGFNWEHYMQAPEIHSLNKHGRGIALSRLISFDEMTYTALGNQVICKKAISR